MRRTRARLILFATLTQALLLGSIEVGIRTAFWLRNWQVTEIPLPYVIGDDYGPVPPWLESLLILTPDPELLWENRPSVRRRYADLFRPAGSSGERIELIRRFSPTIPKEVDRGGTWEIQINSAGFRDTEPRIPKPLSTIRIVCLGDSWTFGISVDQHEAYPQRLQGRLQERFPRRRIEVWNRGVMGYTSFQGVQLLKAHLEEWDPDLVVIGYAMNDSKVTGWKDIDHAKETAHPSFATTVRTFFAHSELFRLLDYFVAVNRLETADAGEYILQEAEDEEAAAEELQPVSTFGMEDARVPVRDYQENIAEMIRLARSKGADVVLLYNELWQDGPYLSALRNLAAKHSVALVDGSSILAAARRRVEAELETQLGLQTPQNGDPSDGGGREVILRVYAGNYAVPKSMYVVGASPEMGQLLPNRVSMYDDGTHGDQRAADHVWSLALTVAPESRRIPYVYTNSGQMGVWNGMDVPHIRTLVVDQAVAGRRTYAPIDTFGRVYMQADSWHADAAGYDLIAAAVSDAIASNLKSDESAH